MSVIPLRRCSQAAAREFDDEPTREVRTLGSLVRAPALVVAEATPLAELRHLLAEHRVPALAVFDDDDRLTGIVTRTDVLRGVDGVVAADVMSHYVLALSCTASIARAAALLACEDVGQIVVVGPGGALVGIVSAPELVRHFAS